MTEWRNAALEEEVDAAWQAFADAGAEWPCAMRTSTARPSRKPAPAWSPSFIAKGDFTQEFYDALKG